MRTKRLSLAEYLLIILFALVPLFIQLPYRINIFLSWEGAYRMSLGQLPFRDFGTPIGGVYWMVPALFFKMFGPQMISLIKAQVFLNIISGLAFRAILKKLSFDPIARFIAIVVFILSFSFINFWPWYNHSVIVYELLALAFLLNHLLSANKPHHYPSVMMAAFFSVCSFLTKQDAGALTILISLFLLGYAFIVEKKWIPLLYYISGIAIFLITYILITSFAGFSYWFNHGQAPHSSRVHTMDFLEEFFSGSQWIKFYLVLMVVLSIDIFANIKKTFWDKRIMIPFLLTTGILVEAVIFNVTSYIPPDNNIFFHSFAIAFILNRFLQTDIHKGRTKPFFYATLIMVLIWWSPNYWKYMQVVLKPFAVNQKNSNNNGENVVDRNTYKFSDVDMGVPMNEWEQNGLSTLKKITLPKPTNDGIKRLLQMDLIRQQKNLKVLNMTELTSLAAEIPFELEKGETYPLWFHLGVGMFNKQAEMFENRIAQNYYDLILFEYIPSLNNFYPFRTRDVLKEKYQQIDSFLAPRRGETQGMIEVFVKR